MVRMDASTQKEHREVAIAISEEVNKAFPITWSAVKTYCLNEKGE
jgi:thymidylate synthase ThyX